MSPSKIILSALAASAAVTGVAQAQTGELRRDRQDLRQERRDLREAQAYGTRRDIRDERQDVRESRRELRQDWRDYRRTNRDVYHLPGYVGPRGYRYRPVAIGYRFQPAYYGQRYWISDPYRYRLPVAAGPNRWVRYGNDVALVNTRNGRVVEVYNGFFW